MIADVLTSATYWEHQALEAQGMTTHHNVIDKLMVQANPPPGWRAVWEPQQWLIYFHHPTTDWKHYPPAGDLIPREHHFYCHQCNWPMRDKFGLIGYCTECWWCKENEVVDDEAKSLVTEVVDDEAK